MAKTRTVPDLAVGDVVRWTSTSKGTARRKMGTVAAVVPAGRQPDRAAFGKLWNTGAGPGLPRKTVSYVVLVKRPRSEQPYWPRPELLNKYEQLSPGPVPKEADLMTRHQPASVPGEGWITGVDLASGPDRTVEFTTEGDGGGDGD